MFAGGARSGSSKEIREKRFTSSEDLWEIKKFYIKIMEHEKFNFDSTNLWIIRKSLDTGHSAYARIVTTRVFPTEKEFIEIKSILRLFLYGMLFAKNLEGLFRKYTFNQAINLFKH